MPTKYPKLYEDILAAMLEARISVDELDRKYFQDLLTEITTTAEQIKMKESSKKDALKELSTISYPAFKKAVVDNHLYSGSTADKFIELAKKVVDKHYSKIK